MPEITAKLSYLRIAPRKVRLLADMIRGKKVPEAKALLNFNLKRGAGPMAKLLNSAIANAKNNFEFTDETLLYVSMIKVDEGPKLKRWRARSRGRAFRIEKKTSHISLMLSDKKPKEKAIKYQKVERILTLKNGEKIIKSDKLKKDTGFAPVKKEAKIKAEKFEKPKKITLKSKKSLKT